MKARLLRMWSAVKSFGHRVVHGSNPKTPLPIAPAATPTPIRPHTPLPVQSTHHTPIPRRPEAFELTPEQTARIFHSQEQGSASSRESNPANKKMDSRTSRSGTQPKMNAVSPEEMQRRLESHLEKMVENQPKKSKTGPATTSWAEDSLTFFKQIEEGKVKDRKTAMRRVAELRTKAIASGASEIDVRITIAGLNEVLTHHFQKRH